MATSDASVEVTVAETATPELVEAFGRLLPQLSSSAKPLTRETLAEIIAAPYNTLLLARAPGAHGGIVGTLTPLIFRTPTALRAWTADVAVDVRAPGRRVGAACAHAASVPATRACAST